jgi:hypothetical protein
LRIADVHCVIFPRLEGSHENEEVLIGLSGGLVRKGDDGQWRIARYGFSPTNPPRA